MTIPVPVSQAKLSPLAEVQSRFAAWRENRPTSRSSIPEELWSAAVMLCQGHSVHKISRGLRLNHTALKKRVACGSSSTCSAESAQAFIAVDIERMMDHAAEVLIEMEHRNGNKMRMHFQGKADFDLHSFAEAFWGDKACCR